MSRNGTIRVSRPGLTPKQWIGLGLVSVGVFYVLGGALAIVDHMLPRELDSAWAATALVFLPYLAWIVCRLLDANDMGEGSPLPNLKFWAGSIFGSVREVERMELSNQYHLSKVEEAITREIERIQSDHGQRTT